MRFPDPVACVSSVSRLRRPTEAIVLHQWALGRWRLPACLAHGGVRLTKWVHTRFGFPDRGVAWWVWFPGPADPWSRRRHRIWSFRCHGGWFRLRSAVFIEAFIGSEHLIVWPDAPRLSTEAASEGLVSACQAGVRVRVLIEPLT